MLSVIKPCRRGMALSGGVLRPFAKCSAVLCGLLLLLLYLSCSKNRKTFTILPSESAVYSTSLVKHALTVATPLLEVFQVYPPVLTVDAVGELELTDGTTSADDLEFLGNAEQVCRQTLVVHSFAYSYGIPFVGNFTPPACSFNRITWNLTVTSAGRQFDRLGIVYLGDIEVFRTSTAEPTTSGIEWIYLKDMTSYSSLFRQPQKLIFDLGNLVDSTYTAAYNVTLSATYFNASDSIEAADLILPISTRQSAENSASVFTVPPDIASNDLTLPRNTRRAVFTIAATGQSDEEFWWSNVPSTTTDTFPQTGTLYGYSPFRELQLYIDGILAGVAWPFPIIFTGGVVPGLWRPIVGIDAFDLKEDEIDITPWLGLLCDGNTHNFTIRVSGLTEDQNGSVTLSETTGSYWLVTGKVFIWLDTSNHTTTGETPTIDTPAPQFHVSSYVGQNANGTVNETLAYRVTAQRSLSISSTIYTSQGQITASWRQSLTFSNVGNLTEQGNVQVNTQSTLGSDESSSGYARSISYPLFAYTSYSTYEDNYTIYADISRGKDVRTAGEGVFPSGLESFSQVQALQSQFPSFSGAALATTQNGTATYVANATSLASFSFGSTSQLMTFSGLDLDTASTVASLASIAGAVELYRRYVSAVNSTVEEDDETLVDIGVAHDYFQLENSNHGFAASGIQALLGRGPGGSAQR